MKRIASVAEMQRTLEYNLNTVIFSFFSEEDMTEEEEGGGGTFEGYSIDAWGQYQAAADSLRG